MNDILHTYVPKVKYSKIQGKPYVTVSAKGISNGLSDTYNDGADFGPDTLLNATLPNQYGPPYTQTTGIQEALNYIQAKGGGDIVVSHGTYTVTTNIAITGSNIRLRGHGRPTLNMNYNKIQGSTSPQENITIENFEIKNGAIQFSTSSTYASYPLPNKHLKIKNVRIVNDLTGINATSVYTVFNWWFDVLLEDFYIYDFNEPVSGGGSDAMGLGANIRFVWNRGYVYAPSIEGAAINWQGRYFSTSTPPAQIDMAGYGVAPFGSTGATNVNYDFINVGIVGDWTALSVYPESWSIRFRGCEFYTTFNTGALYGLIAMQEANNFNNFSLTIEDSVLKVNPNNGASGRIAFNGFSSDVYLTLKNVEFQNFYNGGAPVINVTDGGSFLHILVDNLKIIDFSTSAGGVTILQNANSPAAYEALINNVDYLSVNGIAAFRLFVMSSYGQFEKIVARNVSLRSAVALQNIANNEWIPIYFVQGTVNAEGSLMDIEVNGKRLYFPLDTLIPPIISSTEQIPHFHVTPSTPAVPASGTAQMNTNIYPVEVYLSGGSATEVQVTRGKTTYTVWSSSTAAAIPPLTVRLDPSDSITLTYTTAPTWTWLPVA